MALAGGLFWSLGNELRVEASASEENGVIESKIGDRRVKMMLTGSAIRTRCIFKIYANDSYVEQGLKVRLGPGHGRRGPSQATASCDASQRRRAGHGGSLHDHTAV